jgi:RimJ/RimL family protein N-acetyltransferase
MTSFDFDRPLLVTERLELWLPREGDLKAMYAIVTEAETSRYLGAVAQLHEHSFRFMRGAGSWFLYGYGPLMLRLKGQDAVIGNCGVFHTFRGLGEDFDDHPEAGWIIGAEHVGTGLGREVMEAVLAWFDAAHGKRRIVCMIAPENAASLGLAGRLGFAPFRHAVLPDGETVTLLERGA